MKRPMKKPFCGVPLVPRRSAYIPVRLAARDFGSLADGLFDRPDRKYRNIFSV
jgi:hypothetical protein